jgi:class 3 adenylate cyclase
MAQADDAPALRVIALVLSIAILFAVGSAVRHAKQSWTLVEAVRRHMPNKRLSELLTGGAAIPTEQRLVTVVFTDLRGFTETSARFEPGDLVAWLNTYFTHMGTVIDRHGGAIDKFIGDGIMIIFGLQSPDAQARRALLCALDMLVEIEVWKAASVARGLPAVDMGVGVHSGIVDRRRDRLVAAQAVHGDRLGREHVGAARVGEQGRSRGRDADRAVAGGGAALRVARTPAARRAAGRDAGVAQGRGRRRQRVGGAGLVGCRSAVRAAGRDRGRQPGLMW